MHTYSNLIFLVLLIPNSIVYNQLNLQSYNSEEANILTKDISYFSDVQSGGNEKAPTNPRDGCILLFDKCDFKGNWIQLCEGQSNLYKVNFKKRIASMKLAKDLSVSFFSEINHMGNFRQFTKNNKCVKFGRKVSSLDIKSKQSSLIEVFSAYVKAPIKPNKGCIFLFRDCNYQGKWIKICKSVESLDQYSFSSQISSLKIGKATKTKVFSEINFQGSSHLFKYTQDTSCLSDQKFDDLTNSVKVLIEKKRMQKINIYQRNVPSPQKPGNGCVLLFNECDFKGKWAHVCSDFDLVSDKYDIVIKSIKVSSSANVNMFTGNKFIGDKYMPESNISCLNHKINSLKIKSKKTQNYVATFPPHIEQAKKIKKGCIEVFENCDYSGKWALLCGKMDNLKVIGFQNKIKSMKLGKNSYVKMWSKNDQQGKSKKFKKNKKCMKDNQLFKEVNSLEIKVMKDSKLMKFKIEKKLKIFKSGKKFKNGVNKNCMLGYEKCNFKGRVVKICKSIDDLKKFKFEGRIKSVKLGRNLKLVIFHREVDFKNEYLEIGKDNSCLKRQNEKEKEINSIKLLRKEEKKKRDNMY